MRRRTKHTKQQLGKGIVAMIHAKQAGLPYKPGRKDGGIPTKPVVPCKEQSEADVTTECVTWLKKHRVGVKRMNVGAGDITGRGDFRTYGIKGASDVLCIYHGLLIAIEFKKGKGGVLNKNQQDFREWVERFEGIYIIVHGVPELEFFMLSILQG